MYFYCLLILIIIFLLIGLIKIKVSDKKNFNYDNNHIFFPKEYYTPKSILEIQNIVRNAIKNKKIIRVRGGKHVWNDISVSKNILIDMKNFDKITDISENQVTVQAGVTLEGLLFELKKYGKTLSECSTAYEVSVGGCISTCCHGHRISDGSMSSLIEKVTLIDGQGKLRVIRKRDYLFPAIALGLGCLGIILEVTFRIVNDFIIENNNLKNTIKKRKEMLSIQEIINKNLSPKNDFMVLVSDVYQPFNINLTLGSIKTLKRKEVNFSLIKKPITCRKINYKIDVYEYLKRFGISNSLKIVGYLGSKTNNKFLMDKAVDLSQNTKKKVQEGYQKFGHPNPNPHWTDVEIFISAEHTLKAIIDIIDIIKKYKYDFKIIPLCIRFKGKDNNILLSPLKHNYNAGIDFGTWKSESSSFNMNKRISHMLMNKYQGRPHWGKVHFLNHTWMKNLYGQDYHLFMKIRNIMDPHNIFKNEYISRIM